MAITRSTMYDGEVIGDWVVQVRRTETYWEDDVVISKTHERHVIHPDCDWENSDCNGFGKLPTKIKNLCAALFTDEVKTEYEAEKVRLNEYNYSDNPRPALSPNDTESLGFPRKN